MIGKTLGSGRNGLVRKLQAFFLPNVAIKTSGSNSNLRHEAELLSDICHPNVVAGYGTMWGPPEANGTKTLYLAMECMSHSLEDRRKDFG